MLQRILRFKMFAALLTFVVGVAVGMLFIMANRPYAGENIPTYFEKENRRPNLIDVDLWLEYQIPPVKAFYVSTESDTEVAEVGSMDIAIFYADGKWGSVGDEGCYLGGNKLYITASDRYGASIGTWAETQNGVLVTEEEAHQFFPDQGFTEKDSDLLLHQKKWELVKGTFGKPGRVLKYQNWTYIYTEREEQGEKVIERKPFTYKTRIYKFVRPEKIGDIDGVLSEPLWVKDSHKFLPADKFR